MQVWGGHTEEKEKWNSLSIMKKDGLGLYDGEEETVVTGDFVRFQVVLPQRDISGSLAGDLCVDGRGSFYH